MAEQSHRVADQEARFVEAFVATGDMTAAARTAGYVKVRETASKLMRRPDVIMAVRTAALARLHTEGAMVAANTLIEIASDKSAPKNPRVAAAKAIAEIIGFNSVEREILDKPLSEMSRAELSAAKDRALAYLAELERPVIEGTAVELPDDEAAAGDALLPGGLFD